MADQINLAAECQRLHDETIRLLESEQQTRTQLNAGREMLTKLRLNNKRLEYKLNNQMSENGPVLDQCAQVSCRMLCALMHRKLPPELRDMVYSHLHAEQQIDHSRSNVSPFEHYHDDAAPAWSFRDISSCCEHDCEDSGPERHPLARTSDLEHLWKEEFLGKDVFQELLEYYFRSTRFIFSADQTDISRFQVLPFRNLNIVPADYVANIELFLMFERDEEQRVLSNTGWGVSSGRALCIPLGSDQRESILLGLQALSGFKVGTKLRIRIEPDWKIVPKDQLNELISICDSVLPLIFPTLERLQSAGSVVSVVCNFDSGHFVVDTPLTSLVAVMDQFANFKSYELKRKQERCEAMKAQRDKNGENGAEDEDAESDSGAEDDMWGSMDEDAE